MNIVFAVDDIAFFLIKSPVGAVQAEFEVELKINCTLSCLCESTGRITSVRCTTNASNETCSLGAVGEKKNDGENSCDDFHNEFIFLRDRF